MRVSSQMQNTSYLNLQSSKVYKSFLEKEDEKTIDSNDDKNTVDAKDIKLVAENVIVEKKEDNTFFQELIMRIKTQFLVNIMPTQNLV